MRKLVVTENVTVDGVADGLGEWFSPYGGNDLREANDEHSAAADAVLLGRVTYREFESYWPRQTDDTTGVTDYLNRTDKFVVSTTLESAEWENSTILRSVADEVAGLKERPGKDIVVAGSLTLVQSLIEAGLVDEYRFFVYPVVQGRGRRVFSESGQRGVELDEVRRFREGVVLLTYRAT